MHREHMETAISAASVGGKVVVFADTLPVVQDIAHTIEDAVPADYIARVSRANGRHVIDFHGGGSIRFVSTNQSGRGMSIDRAYVPIGTKLDHLREIIPMLATSPDGVLTGY